MKSTYIQLSQFEKRNRKYLLLLISFLLYTQLYGSLFEKIIITKVSPYLVFDCTIFGDFVFGFILIFSIIALIIKVSISFWKKKPKIEDIYWPFFLAILYLTHRFTFIGTSELSFLSFKCIYFLKYFDGLFLMALYFSFNPKNVLRKKEKDQNIPELLEDNLIQKKGGEDIFKRVSYASYISDLILNQKTRTSFAIGIRGSWGSGKSVFLKQIESKMNNVISVRFNPWLSKSTNDVLGDFFKILVEKTSNYDSGLSKSFRKYYSNLVDLDENVGKKIMSSLGIVKSVKDLSLEDQQNGIINRLKKNDLKIVVFIDDLDRLSSDEILSVLHLIRNSFNFPNTYFLIAYDDAYIRNTLRKKIDNPERFLEKIFQLDIDLPSFPMDLIKVQLLELLTVNKTVVQKEKITSAIQFIGDSGVLGSTIQNLRDAIRFANSFNHIYKKKINEVDDYDFILLELLKIKYRIIYEELRTALVSVSSVDFLKIPHDGFSGNEHIVFIESKKIATKHPAYSLLSLLFNRKDNVDDVKSIRLIGNSIRYFSDDLFGVISYAVFEHYKDNTFDSFKQLIDEQFQNGNIEEVANKILRIKSFSDAHSFFNLNKALLHICFLKQEYTYSDIVYENVKNNYEILNSAFQNNDEFISYFTKLFSSDSEAAIAESKVLGKILRVSLDESNDAFDLPYFNTELVTDVLLKNMSNFIKSHNSVFDKMVFEIYYQIRKSKKGDKVILDKRADELMRDYVLSNLNSYFKEWLLRPKYSGNIGHGMYVLEPFIDHYLKYDEFERLLYLQESNYEVTKLQTFFVRYKDSGFVEAEYSPNKLEIVSDKETLFVGSPSYPELKYGKSCIRADKVIFSDRHKSLENAKWIAHAEKFTIDEQENGGLYEFKREFSLKGNAKSINSAFIYLLVDDFLKIVINGNEITEEFEGFNKPPMVSDIKKYLNSDFNIIIFKVRNIPYKREVLELEPDSNPYDFIYKIVIEFDSKI